MTGLVCLQGGGELSPGCRPMDAEVLRRAGGRAASAAPVRVAVVALAASPGREHSVAAQNGVDHYGALGADPVAVPDARDDPDAALTALTGARLVVLLGGSPSRLLTGLRTTPVGAWLVEAVRSGVAVSGASAGAMVLCEWTVLPDGAAPEVSTGLGLVPGVAVLPHWTGADRPGWRGALAGSAPADLLLLGLPEESGLLLQDGRATAVGQRASSLLGERRELAPGETCTMVRARGSAVP